MTVAVGGGVTRAAARPPGGDGLVLVHGLLQDQNLILNPQQPPDRRPSRSSASASRPGSSQFRALLRHT